jgi:hypothetical protein
MSFAERSWLKQFPQAIIVQDQSTQSSFHSSKCSFFVDPAAKAQHFDN